MNDIERTCREMGWVEGLELFVDSNNPIAAAMRVVAPDEWQAFEDAVNCAGVFVNADVGEVATITTWEQLCLDYGYLVYKEDLAIPMELPDDARTALIELRDMLAKFGDTATGGCKAFHVPTGGHGALAEIHHDGGALAPYFNWDYEQPEMAARALDVFARRGMYIESINPAVSRIYLA
jgi:hypothetical protein